MLHWQTVNDALAEILKKLMDADPFASFRLVGGTALSLQLGHRMSVDIDLFTDAAYGSVDFTAITGFLNGNFAYVTSSDYAEAGFGQTYFVGHNEQDAVKLDLFYTDTFIRPEQVAEGIRMADAEEIIAMKMDVVSRGGRMKDFWDLHELMDNYTPAEMIALHAERYPYGHDTAELRERFTDFSEADNDFLPICLRGKHWELIKLDIVEALLNEECL